jgi:GGDEF domain-containing protein
MSNNNNKIDKLFAELFEEPKILSNGKMKTLVHPLQTMKDQKEKLQIILDNYKRDDSAEVAGRNIIGYRQIGDKVDPLNMTRKEYTHFLCRKFGFKVGKGWDGIEARHHRPNWSIDESHNVETLEDAAKFLELPLLPSAPDGVEKRKSIRRSGQKDIRKKKVERRTKGRRKADLEANIAYIGTATGAIAMMFSWTVAHTFLYFKDLATPTQAKRITPTIRKNLEIARDVIRTSLIFFDDDLERTASELGISKKQLNTIMTKNKPIAKSTINKIMLNYSEKVASLDYTTEVLNKVAFKVKLEDLQIAEKASIIFINIDNLSDFKTDELQESILREFASNLQDEFKTPDVIARVGLANFGVISYGTNDSTESLLKAKINKITSQSFNVNKSENDIKLKCSIKIQHYPISC